MRMKDLGGFSHLFACTFLFYFSVYMVSPALTDVTLEALCPGHDECSLAIYLSGFQQAVTGLGALMVTPLVGNLSDMYGRKALLNLPMSVAIIPLAILAYDRSRMYFYAYYIIKMVTGMFCEGSMQCLSLAYLADSVCESQRAAAFGILTGVSSAGFVIGTLTARFLSTSSIFKVAATTALLAAVYMKVFLQETNCVIEISDDESTRPLCSHAPNHCESPPKLPLRRKVASLVDMLRTLRSSLTLSRVAIVTLFIGLAENGLQSGLLFFLKAQFHFNKNQFADLMLIAGGAGVLSQLLLMPSLAPRFGEEKLLNVGLLASCVHIFLYSVAWASWVPYCSAFFIIFSVFIQPCLRSIVSRKVGNNEQGMAQGCITGINSFASILSPFIFAPLTACFLSDNAPFNFKGFSLMCAGFISILAFICSITMKIAPDILKA